MSIRYQPGELFLRRNGELCSLISERAGLHGSVAEERLCLPAGPASGSFSFGLPGLPQNSTTDETAPPGDPKRLSIIGCISYLRWWRNSSINSSAVGSEIAVLYSASVDLATVRDCLMMSMSGTCACTDAFLNSVSNVIK